MMSGALNFLINFLKPGHDECRRIVRKTHFSNVSLVGFSLTDRINGDKIVLEREKRLNNKKKMKRIKSDILQII